MNDPRLRVHEPPSGVSPGVLETVWRGGDMLPLMGPFELIKYFLGGGWRTITSVPVSSTIAVATIAICVFLLGGVLFGIRNVDEFITQVGTPRDVTAYLREGVTLSDVNEFSSGLKSNSIVRETKYLSKEEALKLFKQDLGERSSFLEALEGENPLPASVEISLKSELASEQATSSLISYLKSNPIVGEVIYGSIWVEKVKAVLRLFRLIGGGILCVVITILVFLITNTIKLVIYSRQDEIEIMQLVGASDNFVNIPFVLGGAVQGFIGSVLGIVLLDFGWVLLNRQLTGTSLLGVALPQFSFLPWALIMAIILFGIAIGALGSYFAIRKFLTV